MNTPRADGCRVCPTPTRASYTTPAGEVIVPLWVTRYGHHLGDLNLVLTTEDPSSRLAHVLADPAELDHLIAHVQAHPGSRVSPLRADQQRVARGG